jgi:hypothetical protein
MFSVSISLSLSRSVYIQMMPDKFDKEEKEGEEDNTFLLSFAHYRRKMRRREKAHHY